MDAPDSLAIYRLCADLGWPVLLHFEYGVYNPNFEAFEGVLRAHPETVFVGHAQAWWANISADAPRDPDGPRLHRLSRRARCVPGGLTDRWLEEFPNLYADLSAGSGCGALSRDPEFTRGLPAAPRSASCSGPRTAPAGTARATGAEAGSGSASPPAACPCCAALCASPEAFARDHVRERPPRAGALRATSDVRQAPGHKCEVRRSEVRGMEAGGGERERWRSG